MRQSKSDVVVLQAASNTEQAADQPQGPTIYYDGSCPLCSAEIKHYASQEGGDTLDFVDVSADGTDLGGDLACDTAMKRFHVRQSDGTLLSGASAFVAVWAALPRWQWAARLAKLPGVTSLLEVAYRGFLPIRPLLSRLAGLVSGRSRSEQK